MSAGPRGPTAGPLDLRAVEELLDARNDSLTVIVPTGNLRTLLAHCRALRAALAETLPAVRAIASIATVVDHKTLDANAAFWEAVEERAAAVLAQATDAETG